MNKAGLILIILTAGTIIILYAAAMIGTLKTRQEELTKNETI